MRNFPLTTLAATLSAPATPAQPSHRASSPFRPATEGGKTHESRMEAKKQQRKWAEKGKKFVALQINNGPVAPAASRHRKKPSRSMDNNEKKPRTAYADVQEVRPRELECDVVRFQNNKEKWVAFVGLLDGRPYEIFTGLQDDEEGIMLPKSVTHGKIIKQTNADGSHRYDFQFENKRGYKTTVEGLSEKFNPEYWNYAKLISGVLRYRMPIDRVTKLVGSLQLKDESINTWKNGVERALKKYITDGTQAVGEHCPSCGEETLIYKGGCLVCTQCGAIRNA